MLRRAPIILLASLTVYAAPPKRMCGGLPNDTFAVDGAPSTVSLVFTAPSAYFLFDSGKSSPLLQSFPIVQTSRECGTSGGSVLPMPAGVLASRPLAGADFNGDGIPDAVSLNFEPNRVSVFLGDSTGALKPFISYIIGASPESIVVADFNGDGKLDLAIADSGNAPSDPGGVSVLLGNGDGTFRAPVKYRTAKGPVSLAAADFDRDGRLDLAVANGQSENVSILFGKGDGTFPRSADAFVDQGPASILAADFNGDGFPDLAVSNDISGTLSILLGYGDGTFQPSISYNIGFEPGYLASADFNGDGKPDLAVLFESSDSLAILLGKGDGFFALPVNYVVGASPTSLALADLDGDGSVDILAPDPGSHSILILWGRSDGTFEAPPLYAVGSAPQAVAMADFNGDGILDLVTPNQGSGDVSILLGAGDGKFRVPARVRLSDPSPRPVSVAVGDFNGDGKPDLAIGESAPLDRVAILLGKGDGTFQATASFPAGPDPQFVFAADFDGDGKLDLAVANGNRSSATDFGSLAILLGNGDGTFRAAVNYAAGVRPYSIVAGDFNGDGKLDLAVGSSGDANARQPETVAILLGAGDGTFAPAQYIVVGDNPSAAAPPASIAVGDLNLDGKLDLVVTVSSTVLVLIGNGDGTFQASSYPTTSGARFVAIADLDGDGNPDLVTAHCCDAGDMSYMPGNGDGTFRPEAHFPGGASPVGIAIGDFNSDGRPDLAVADGVQNGAVAILLNRLGR